jgi:(1->4)-alpha-D-glucan 1-alpha-D-glucosylmutase
LAPFGLLNSLVQTLLKLTCPGVPDIYQGCEFWDFSLVDPDNRRSVDYAVRRESMTEMQPYLDLLFAKNKAACDDLNQMRLRGDSRLSYVSSCRDQPQTSECDKLAEFNRRLITDINSGAIKQYLIAAMTRFRALIPELFNEGKYIPIEVCGTREKNVIAFARKFEDTATIVVAPYMIASTILVHSPDDSPTQLFNTINSDEYWQDTCLVLPAELQTMDWQNVFSLQPVRKDEEKVSLSALLQSFPICVLRSRP